MRKLKNMFLFTGLICLFISTSGCGEKNLNELNKNETSTTKVTSNNINYDKKLERKHNQEDFYKVITSKADLKESYSDIESLSNNAEIIIEGEVLNTKSYFSGPGVVTEYKIKVENSYKGNFNGGDTVELLGAGGVVNLYDLINFNGGLKDFEKKEFEKMTDQEKKSKKIKYSFGEAPVVQAGNKFIIFAKKEKVADNKEMYGALGIYQGLVEIEDNNALGWNSQGKISNKTMVDKDIFIKMLKEKLK